MADYCTQGYTNGVPKHGHRRLFASRAIRTAAITQPAGYRALQNNQSGTGNTAIGFQALYNNTTGNVNIALGSDAGANLRALATLLIGSPGEAAINNRTYISHIRGVEVGNGDGITVMIDSDGQLGTI